MSAPSEICGKKLSGRLVFALSVILFLAAAVAWVISEGRPHEQPIEWLSPSQSNRLWRPGLLESIQNRILRWPPAGRFLARNRQGVRIDSHVITLPKVVYIPELKSQLTQTNPTGDVAYLLDRANLVDAEVALASPAASPRLPLNSKTQEGERNRFVLASSMRMTTGSGMRSSMASGNTAPGGAFSGATLDVYPIVRHGRFSLFVRAVFTQPVTNLIAGVFTNASISCRATVPNGGGVLVRHVDETANPAVSYWLIKVTAADAKGNPIELGK